MPHDILLAIFEAASWAPSNCNTQPWLVEIVSGATRDRMVDTLTAAGAQGQYTPDFPFDETMYTGVHGERRRQQGALISRPWALRAMTRKGAVRRS